MLSGLKDRLMAPEAAAEAMRAWAEETNRINRERRASGASDRKELANVEKKIAAMIAVIEDGGYVRGMVDRQRELEARQDELNERLSAVPADLPDIHPNIADVYRRNPAIGFRSYDRFFPSQDTLLKGGFDNLIALPLRGRPREHSNSLFLDDDFEPLADQWAFLSALRRLSMVEATAIADEATRQGRVMDLRLPEDEDEEPWSSPPSRRRPPPKIAGFLPEKIDVVLGGQIYIPRVGLPPGLVNRLIRLAAFQNPAFYSSQAMRRSTFGIPASLPVANCSRATWPCRVVVARRWRVCLTISALASICGTNVIPATPLKPPFSAS